MEEELKIVKNALERHGVTQKEIAAKLNLSQSAVSNMLSGKRQVKHTEFRALLDLIDLHSNQFRIRPRNLPIFLCKNAADWLSESERVGQLTIGLPSGNPAGRFGISVETNDISAQIPIGGVALIDPEQTDLFEGKVYLVRFGRDEPCLRAFRSNPGRFATVPCNGVEEATSVGAMSFVVIGRVIASVNEF